MNSLFESMQFRRAVTTAMWLLVALLAAALIYVVSSIHYIGAGIQPGNTISVSGQGESFAVPDIATFTFSVVSDKATVADAQADATAKANAVTDYLTAAGVDKKDIQTSDYSVSPQYDYQTAVCPQVGTANGAPIYCPPGQQVLKGYEVSQTTTVKVRDTSKAGTLLAGVGSKGATEVSSLQFTFDNPDQVQADARSKAIADAKSKADELARELGVSIVRVVSFNESQGGGQVPIYAKLDASAGSAAAPSAPEISVGQNQVTDNVSITYEIR